MRSLRAALLLGRKDARVLWRSPALIALLIGYPVIIALLVALVLQADERRPAVALVNLEDTEATVRVGEERLSIQDYTDRLDEEVDLLELDPEAAQKALDEGRVVAVLTLPDGFIADLRSGLRPPKLILETDPRQPISGEAIQRRVESVVFQLNQGLAQGYVTNVLALVDLVVNGGELGVFGRSVEAIGLRRARELVEDVQAELRADGQTARAERLDPIVTFIDGAAANLDLARPAASAISTPIELEVIEGDADRNPLSAFGFAGALVASIGLAGALIGATTLSSEHEENALVRLRRGLVSGPSLVGEKIAFTAVACLVIGILLLVLVALVTALTIGRWGLWPPVLLVAGAAFGSFGALVGAAARDARTALLATVMIAMPMVAVGLVPNSPVASTAAAFVPFGPAFEAFQALLVDPDVSSGLGWNIAHLAGLCLAFGAAAVVALRLRNPV